MNTFLLACMHAFLWIKWIFGSQEPCVICKTKWSFPSLRRQKWGGKNKWTQLLWRRRRVRLRKQVRESSEEKEEEKKMKGERLACCRSMKWIARKKRKWKMWGDGLALEIGIIKITCPHYYMWSLSLLRAHPTLDSCVNYMPK